MPVNNAGVDRILRDRAAGAPRAFQFVISRFRTTSWSRPTNLMQMEGSMKTMSWSRYHCLSWSFMRLRGSLRGGGLKPRSLFRLWRAGADSKPRPRKLPGRQAARRERGPDAGRPIVSDP
jgi:hypothetical protein